MTIFNACCRSFRGSDVKAPLDAVIPQEKIGPLYDKISRFYDVWGRLTESKARERALALAHIRDGATVLEAAAGTGLAFERIVRRNPNGRNIGIDLSEGMLAKARRRLWRAGLHNYALFQGSAAALELASDSVDVLVNNYMFDLIPFKEMGPMLEEFRRVLKPGGRLVLVNMTRGRGMGSGLYERLYRLFPRAMGGCRGVALAGRLERSGFEVRRREYVRQMLFPSEVILAVKAWKEGSL
jgi:ubiquinone/menaquinone biosynthesis C-methylase UbiE